jgi:hypothetical protein
VKIQQIIEAGRNSFEADQKSLLDRKRAYEVYAGSWPRSWIASALGFPKIDLNKYGIVTSDRTEKVFEEKKDDPIDVRPDDKK